MGLSSPLRTIEPESLALEGRLDHWTIREVLKAFILCLNVSSHISYSYNISHPDDQIDLASVTVSLKALNMLLKVNTYTVCF